MSIWQRKDIRMHNSILETCNGKGRKVIFIDCGFSCVEKCVDFYGQIIKPNEKEQGIHIDLCINAAKLVAPEAEYVHVTVGKKVQDLTEDNVIKALEFSLRYEPDILVMPFSFEVVSEHFCNLIQLLYRKQVIMCASVNSSFCGAYPQKLREVISVDELDEESVAPFIFNDNIFYVYRNTFTRVFSAGSSIATGYMGGFFAKLKEFNPLANTDTIMNYYQNIWLYRNKQERKIYGAAYCLNKGQHNIDSYMDMVDEAYQYYYDERKEKFFDLKNRKEVKEKEVISLDVICGDDFQTRIPQITKFPNIKVNYFENISKAENIENEDLYSLKNVNVPNICIGSYGVNMDKLLVQLSLTRGFRQKGVKAGNITFNPIGHIFGFDYIKYPNKIVFPDYFYYLNNRMRKESEKNDVLITSMPGSVDRFVKFDHIISGIPHIIMSTSMPDLIIISVSLFVEIAEIKILKHYIEENIGSCILIYVSKHNRDDIEYSANNYNTILSLTAVKNYAKRIQLFTKTKSFTDEDIDNGKMFEYIYRLLTKRR